MAGLGSNQRQLVCLFAEALLLAQEGRVSVRDRLLLVERLFDLSLHGMRKRAKDGSLSARDLSTLDREFGISSDWILHGDARALSHRIVAFSREALVD